MPNAEMPNLDARPAKMPFLNRPGVSRGPGNLIGVPVLVPLAVVSGIALACYVLTPRNPKRA